MPEHEHTAALIALTRGGRRPAREYSWLVEERGEASSLLDEDLGLLADAEIRRAERDLAGWRKLGLRSLTVLDAEYPANLRAAHDRPPLIFIAGALTDRDARSVAVVGSRRASASGLALARAIARQLCQEGYTVASGLAAGIDTAAHTAALDSGGRTIAVIGTGLLRCYPPENESLQHRIAESGAVVSQFWPEDPPSRTRFPDRNAVMSGISLATVVVEASVRSGARTQVRRALAQGRPVLLTASLVEQDWARHLARRPGTHVVSSPAELTEVVARLTEPGPLVL